jgi:hypothetical protein
MEAPVIVLYFVLLLLSAVCFVLSALGFSHRKLNFFALGLFFWVMVPLLQTLQRL